jgi:polyisoprenoid-binding protein YceI
MFPSRFLFRLSPLVLVLLAAGGPCRADAYRFDARHTVASFRCGPFGFGPQSGRVTGARGAIVFDPQRPGDSVVDVSLDMTTLHTDWRAFDGQVRGPDFLDVERFPTASFRSRRVEVTGDGAARVTGDLTLHGVTREVTLAVVVRRASDRADSLGFSARATIRRSDFGVDHEEPFLSDTIDLRIEARAAAF